MNTISVNEKKIKDNVISSPIRWAGSKKKILNDMLKIFSIKKEVYVEPFLGSAVVLLNVLNNSETLGYNKFYVNDINGDIIGFFEALRAQTNEFISILTTLIEKYNNLLDIEEKEKFYYIIRENFNNEKYKNKRHEYFFFLMKAGFNGVYRLNKSGNFNVPFGKKEKLCVQIDMLKHISLLIDKVHFYNLQYDDFLDELEREKVLKQSFIYCDPPYLPEDKAVYQTQLLYTSKVFEHDKFIQKMISIENADIMISMSDTLLSNVIYSNYNMNKIHLEEIIRIINPNKKVKSKEVIYTNYQ